MNKNDIKNELEFMNELGTKISSVNTENETQAELSKSMIGFMIDKTAGNIVAIVDKEIAETRRQWQTKLNEARADIEEFETMMIEGTEGFIDYEFLDMLNNGTNDVFTQKALEREGVRQDFPLYDKRLCNEIIKEMSDDEKNKLREDVKKIEMMSDGNLLDVKKNAEVAKTKREIMNAFYKYSQGFDSASLSELKNLKTEIVKRGKEAQKKAKSKRVKSKKAPRKKLKTAKKKRR